MAKWLEQPPSEREVVGSIHGHNRSKSLNVVALAFPLGAQVYDWPTNVRIMD